MFQLKCADISRNRRREALGSIDRTIICLRIRLGVLCKDLKEVINAAILEQFIAKGAGFAIAGWNWALLANELSPHRAWRTLCWELGKQRSVTDEVGRTVCADMAPAGKMVTSVITAKCISKCSWEGSPTTSSARPLHYTAFQGAAMWYEFRSFYGKPIRYLQRSKALIGIELRFVWI
jgi:hypothetical protein